MGILGNGTCSVSFFFSSLNTVCKTYTWLVCRWLLQNMPWGVSVPLHPLPPGWVPGLLPTHYFQIITDMNTLSTPLTDQAGAGLWDIYPGEESLVLGHISDRFFERLSQVTLPPAVHTVSPRLKTSSTLTVNNLFFFSQMGIIYYVHCFNCISLIINESENLVCEFTLYILCPVSTRFSVLFLLIRRSSLYSIKVVF